MTHLSPNKKHLSLWQRLLIVLNAGGPQWGRPQGDDRDRNGSKDEPEESSDEDEGEPSNERDPKDKPNSPSDKDESPPDLDEIWKDLSGRLGGLLGGGSNGGGGSGRRPPKRSGRSGGRPPVSGKGAGVGIVVVVFFAVLAWVGSGLFTVQEGQQAVILTFGKHTRTVKPGLSWRFPFPIESHEIVAADQLKSVDIGNATVNSITGLNNASMLTQDKNILDIRFTVQYRIKKIETFLFNNVNPDDAVTQAAESAVREVVGRSPMDVVIQRESCSTIRLTEEELQARNRVQKPAGSTDASGRPIASTMEGSSGTSIDAVIEQIADESVIIPREAAIDNTKATCAGTRQESLSAPILESIQSQLDKLSTGIEIFNVNILDVQVPDKVKPAFDEARSATAERSSLINEGWAYANATVASAKGVVARLEADSNAYKMSVVSKAAGETQRFVEIYEQYRLAPDITRRRMYLETMQQVYGNVSKIMMESGNNSLLYVPIDRLMNPQGQNSTMDVTPLQNQSSESRDGVAAANNAAASTSGASGASSRQEVGVRNTNRTR
ncbi:MAG: protease modulator HflK [Saezia sp.]